MFSLQGITGIFYLVKCLSQNNTSISKTMKIKLVTLARFSVLMQAKIYHLGTAAALTQFTDNRSRERMEEMVQERQKGCI